ASSDCADSSLKETWNLERPFTSSLGVPHQWPHSVSPKLSIISDAGDQQQLRLKRTLAQPEESFDENYDIEQSLASLPPLGPTHELQEQILDARQRTRNNEGQIRKFIPKEDLCRVVNTDSVTRALMKELSQVHSHEQIRSYAKVICTELETNEIQRGKAKIKSFRKIFALLVLVEAASSIVRFLDEDVSDQDLPLTLVRRQGTDELYRKGNRNKKPLRCFKLSPVKLENFQEYQWWMLAPYFSPGEDGVMKHYILQDDHILPFVDPDDADEGGVVIKTGGYGRVLMVRIHPDHHNFRDRQLCERGFAIKQQIYDSDRDTFKREVRVLKEFSGDRSHPHVVSLLATYEQFRKFHLIFYRAEGDLFDHWKKMKPRPDLTYSNVVWVATQCTGIAEGLLKLHKLLSFHKVQAEMVESQSEDNNISTEKRVRIIEPIHDRVGTDSSILSNGVKERAASPIKWPNQKDGHRFDSNEDARCKQYGRHGDINPANILWYNGNDDDAGCLQGTLKIADFGQAELNSLLSRTKRRSVANTLTYRPPECDLPSSIIRQSYDIWCLGCVYLEFVTWLLGGEQLLMKFVRLRMAPDVFQQGQLSDTFFQAVRNHETFPPEIEIKPKVTQFIDDLHRNPKCTVYLHEFLNMIQNDMLVVESSERKQCASIWNRLDSMTRKCHQDEDYAATYNPWYFKQTSVSRSVELKMTPDVRQAIEKNLPLRPATPARAVLTWYIRRSIRRSVFMLRSSVPSLISLVIVLESPQCVNRPFQTARGKGRVRMQLSRGVRYWRHAAACFGVIPRSVYAELSTHRHRFPDVRILDSMVDGTFHDPARSYLPESAINDLIVQDTVEQELRKIEENPTKETRNFNGEFRSKLATWIVENARRVFAVTIQCDLQPRFLFFSMLLFRSQDFTDSKLADLQSSRPPSQEFSNRIWKPLQLDTFFDKRWKFLVPVFSQAKYDYDLCAERIFPFTSDGAVPKDGAFSSVYRIKIHKDHQQHPGLQDIALKELKVPRGDEQSGTDRAWELEASALEAINKLDHPHIVKCIAAIRRGNSRYFMFPWADGDSLRDFWDETPRQAPNANIIEQAIVQLRGIADALDRLHNFDGGRSDDDAIGRGISIRLETPVVQETQLHNETNGERQVKLDNEVDDYKNAEKAESIRHGDLKPENILRFLDKQSDLGTLKIADMGLAKRHVVATQERGKATSTRYGTRRYEAPETVTAKNARSRLYDIWSMGCITFEFIIWILYGNVELKNLYTQIEGNAQQVCQYYEIVDTNELQGARIHPVVLRWLEHVEKNDPECSVDFNSAIKDLLRLVREQLLIVPLPPNRKSSTVGGRGLAPPALGQTVTRYRATAAQFRDALDGILSKAKVPGYIFTGNDRTNINPPRPKSSTLLSPRTANRSEYFSFPKPNSPTLGPLKSGVLGRPVGADYTLPPLKDWQFYVDNTFAEKVTTAAGIKTLSPQLGKQQRLCNQCSNLNFWKGGFSIEVKASDLAAKAASCQFCKMLNDSFNEAEDARGDKARFTRDQSSILISGDAFPVLSIVRSPELNTPLPIQVGFPELPEPGTNVFFSITRMWLEDCDSVHERCQGFSESLPTRLIDVGTIDAPMLRLTETNRGKISSRKYIALSHPWGNTQKYPPFSTMRKDMDMFKEAIPEDKLPATFRDAVKVTRELSIRYLWIDSLCIIQGPDGDFNDEAKRMEDVFNGAFCVLAASRANSQRDGFLGPRPKREYVTFQHDAEKPFYVCKNIDNFSKDVIEGSLNKRGWVLQERALARRTIYFTKSQTYFECGEGVRCETLTRMQNNMADFLGDPNFPDKAMRANRAEKIAYFQGLYKQYSRLDFTRYEDRPFAIAGLEKRLQRAFGTRGAYGIFDDGDKTDGGLFHRSLLWQRGEEKGDAGNLTPIEFPPERNVRVPSWSWMAYKGGIDYIDPPFNTADWEIEEVVPPWTRGGNRDTDTAPQDGEIAIIATVRDFKVAGRQPGEVELTYDTERMRGSDGQRTQCVVVAKTKGASSNQTRRYYVLLVNSMNATAGRGERFYRRVGAGVMLGKFITFDSPGIAAKII
ncbi:uncharacterized protein K460DRAFT_274684, partial [Cucurbitaria berberidis CBS 394.84]